MAELTIEGTHAEQAAQMKTAIIHLWGVLKGNGQSGLEQDVAVIKAGIRVLVWLISVLIAGLGVWIATLEYRSKTSQEILPGQQTQQDYAKDVRMPEMAKE